LHGVQIFGGDNNNFLASPDMHVMSNVLKHLYREISIAAFRLNPPKHCNGFIDIYKTVFVAKQK